MKKIIGSPIGLEEVNLTVDNRVRRRIKEYFGNVDDNRFKIKVILPENIKDVEYNTSKLSYIKIGVKAPKEHLNRTFIIELPNKYEFFIPTNKNGDWIESEPLFMSRDSFDIIKNQQVNFSAKLPETDDEKEAARLWKKDKDDTAKLVASAAAGATQGTIDKENSEDNKEQLCNNRPKGDCHEWNDTKKVCEQVLDKGGCVEDNIELCCTSIECKNKKDRNFIKKTLKSLKLMIIILSIITLFAFLYYSDIYGHRYGNILFSIINFFRKDKIGKDTNYGIHVLTYSDSDHTVDLLNVSGVVFFLLLTVLALIVYSYYEYSIGTLTTPFKECTFNEENKKKKKNIKDDSCPLGKSKKTCSDGTAKCRYNCSKNKKFSRYKCKCIPK